MQKDSKITNRKSKILSYSESTANLFRNEEAEIDLTVSDRLMIRSMPKPNESFMGYIVRLTEENGYDNPSRILRLANLEYRQSFSRAEIFKDSKDLSRLAFLTGSNTTELEALTYPSVDTAQHEPAHLFYDFPLRRYLIRPERPKVCPDCLRESGYCYRIWDLLLVTACPLHRRLLIDICPGCRSDIPNNRNHVSICSCKYDYRLSPASPVEEDQLGLTIQVHALCGLTNTKFRVQERRTPIHTLSLSELADLIFFVMSHHRNDFIGITKYYVNPNNNAELHKDLVKAYDVFEEWPHRYYEFLESRQLRDEKKQSISKGPYGSGLGKCFSAVRGEIYKKFTSSSFDFLRSAFSQYVTTHWHGKSTSETMENISAEITYLTRTEASQQLDVNTKYINFLVTKKRLKAVIRQSGKARMFLIDADSLAQVKGEHDGSLDAQEVAKQLGVGITAVTRLASNGCLKPLCDPALSSLYILRFKNNSAAELISAIRSKINPRRRISRARASNFHAVSRRLNSCNIKLSDFINSIMLDEIAPCSELTTKIGLARFSFLTSDIDAYLKTRTSRRERKFGRTYVYGGKIIYTDDAP